MTRPTGRTVLIFAAGIPLALFIVIYNPGLWALSFNYVLLVGLITASDLLLALSSRVIDVKIATPERLYIGERGAITVTLRAVRYRRTARFELIAEQRGDIEPADIVAGTLPAGQE